MATLIDWLRAKKEKIPRPKEMLIFIDGRPIFVAVFLIFHCFVIDAKLKGHLEPLGEQQAPSVHTEELGAEDVPLPEAFHAKYVNLNRPVVFRGAAKKSRAYKYWTEEYLSENYGNVTVRLEARDEKNNRIPVGVVGFGLDLLGNFIKNYQMLDSYVISQIPMPMEKDVMIPPCLRCGSFAKSIQEVHLFLSASGGKTALHKDPYNNIHCVFNGTKDWILINPNQTDLLYMSEDSQFEWGGLSYVNVDKIDLNVYPTIAEVEYSKVRLHKGDCIFMPSGYWHQVRSFGHMNSAVAIWFSFLDNFDNTGCGEKESKFTPMSEVEILWRYSGFGNLSQGHMDINILKKTLLLWADENKKISLKTFAEYFFILSEINRRRGAMVADMKSRREKFVRYLDTHGTGFTTKERLNQLSTDEWKDLVELIHPNDISNTDLLEYEHLRVKDIWLVIKESLLGDGNFDERWFLENYTKRLGGTKKIGNEILSALQIPKNGRYTREDILSRIDVALEKFKNALSHDPATEKRIFRFLKFGKLSVQHDEF